MPGRREVARVSPRDGSIRPVRDSLGTSPATRGSGARQAPAVNLDFELVAVEDVARHFGRRRALSASVSRNFITLSTGYPPHGKIRSSPSSGTLELDQVSGEGDGVRAGGTMVVLLGDEPPGSGPAESDGPKA